MNRMSSLYCRKMPFEEIAGILAKRCGHNRTGAEYWLKTVTEDEARGMHDEGLRQLQERVSKCITKSAHCKPNSIPRGAT